MTKSRNVSVSPLRRVGTYTRTTKQIESLETHGKILEMTYPYYQRAGRELALPFMQNLKLSKPRCGSIEKFAGRKIAFFLTGDAKTGHISNFCRLLNLLKAQTKRSIVYFFLIKQVEDYWRCSRGSAFDVINDFGGRRILAVQNPIYIVINGIE